MRTSTALSCPAVTAAEGAPEHVLTALETGPAALDLSDAHGHTARVGIWRDDQKLVVAVLATAPAGSDPAAAPAFPEYYFRRHFIVMFDPLHDHATRWQYSIDDTGAVAATADWTTPGEETVDLATKALPAPPPAQGQFAGLDGRRFLAVLTWPMASLPGAADAGPIGLAVRVGFHEPMIGAPLDWPGFPAWSGTCPIGFGDLFLKPPALRVTDVACPAPTWANPCPVQLRLAATDGPRHGHAVVHTVLPTDDVDYRPVRRPWAVRDGAGVVEVPVEFPHRAKWASDLFHTARLCVRLLDDAGQCLWQGQFPFGFDTGIIVRERFGPPAGALPGRPDPESPDFVDSFRRYLLARLPDYRVKTTRDGAPSDFFLEDPAGAASLDLMDPAALDQAVAMLADRFGDWSDALCAAAMWIYHPLISRHSSSWARVANAVSVDSLPRLGGCFCGETARLGCCLAEKIGRRLGVPLRGLSMGLRGHLCSLIQTPVGAVVIDGMIGLYYHTLDNRRLATLGEMRADARIARRMWYVPRSASHEFFHQNAIQIIRPWQAPERAYPPI